jgi:hypothetical protein
MIITINRNTHFFVGEAKLDTDEETTEGNEDYHRHMENDDEDEQGESKDYENNVNAESDGKAEEADAEEADVEEANAEEANVEEADVEEADVEEADAEEASLDVEISGSGDENNGGIDEEECKPRRRLLKRRLSTDNEGDQGVSTNRRKKRTI